MNDPKEERDNEHELHDRDTVHEENREQEQHMHDHENPNPHNNGDKNPTHHGAGNR